MTNGRERSKEFWFEFDNVFNPSLGFVTDEMFAAVVAVMQHGPRFVYRTHREAHTFPDGFRQEMEAIRDPLLFVSTKQVELLDGEFTGDPDAERTAFELFGQGVLFDERRPPTEKVHKMNIGTDELPDGYHTWHSSIRAAVMFGADADRWLQIDRNVGLAWAIQSEARPVQDAPDNPGLPPARLDELRSAWQDLSFDQLDAAFDSFPFPVGLEQAADAAVAPSGYELPRGELRRGGDAGRPG